ncbi:MAG: hypothetical protein ACT4OT_01040 [Acidobacteriota bacterium]
MLTKSWAPRPNGSILKLSHRREDYPQRHSNQRTAPHDCIRFDDIGSSAESVGSARKQIRKFVEDENAAQRQRVAVRDAGSYQIGTARQFIEVPDLKKNVLTLSGITVTTEAHPNSGNPAVSDLRNAAIRRFLQGSNLWFGYIIYNARTGKASAGASLIAQSRIFQDGKLVYTGEPQPIDLTGQSDSKRISAGGGLKLGMLPVGEYQLQIVVTDQSSEKEKPRITWQMIDFEIVK